MYVISKLCLRFSTTVWYAIHVNFIFSVFFWTNVQSKRTTRAEPEDHFWSADHSLRNFVVKELNVLSDLYRAESGEHTFGTLLNFAKKTFLLQVLKCLLLCVAIGKRQNKCRRYYLHFTKYTSLLKYQLILCSNCGKNSM